MASDELIRLRMTDIVRDAAPSRSIPDTLKYQRLLELGSEHSTLLHQLYSAEAPNDYLSFHLRRFEELFAFIGGWKSAGRLLEIGTAYYTAHFYKKVFPEIELHTLCRPESTGGPPDQWAISGGSTCHTQADLNNVELDGLSARVGAYKFNFIVCCEVIEHLTRDPSEIFCFLRKLMAPSGAALVTTPNFMSIGNMVRLARGKNPAAMFNTYRENINAHFHFREYTIAELIEIAENCSLRVNLAAFSNCWDQGQYQTENDFSLRSNLVMLLSPSLDSDRFN